MNGAAAGMFERRSSLGPMSLISESAETWWQQQRQTLERSPTHPRARIETRQE